ncbi:hypothetical protein [Bradyrhizobium elkanii]|jgi:hypothetical protein|uniref:hypothetical protein n=1 Tax=Bradyrhizobium elkanii TaxID=29448 RepID=UPI0021681BBB|nr:hypothetical protein [Bradyrhizobium elkanii]
MEWNVRQIAQQAAIFGARTLSLTSGAASGAGLRRAAGPARSRAPANSVDLFKGFGRRRACDAQATGWEDVAS